MVVVDPDNGSSQTTLSRVVDPDIVSNSGVVDPEKEGKKTSSKYQYSAIETGTMSFTAESPVMAGAAIGAAAGSVITPIIGTIVGSVIGAGTGMAIKYGLLKALPNSVNEALNESASQHPDAAFAGQIASQGVGFGMGAVGKTIAQKAISVGLGAGIGGGIETAQEAIEGKPLDPKRITIAIAGGGAFSGAVRSVLDKTGKKIIGTVVKDVPISKVVDPDFEKSRIKPDETLSEVFARNKEAKKPPVDEVAVATENMRDTHKASEQANKDRMVLAEMNIKGILAKTDKEGRTYYNDPAIEQDFKDGFPYIFEPKSPTGEQKLAVFEQLGLTKEEFSKRIPDVDTYKAFLKGHEDSHITNKDHESYPRTGEFRAVTLEDKTPPKFLYHGTRADTTVLVNENGDLVLTPAKNFGGKTTSISLTHNEDFASDYATRIKGGGPTGFSFFRAKVIKIESDALPKGISRESGEEWAFNQDTPITIPKGKFSIKEHHLKEKDKYVEAKPPESWSDWLDAMFDRGDIEEILANPVLAAKYERSYIEQMEARSPAYAEHRRSQKIIQKELVEEKTRLEGIANQRSSGKYKEPPVEWAATGKGKPDLMHPDAIKIEARATLDGMKAADAFYEARAIAKSIETADIASPITLEASQELVLTSQRAIREATRKADIFGRRLEKLVPNLAIRDRLTRALEAEKKYDIIFTDKAKHETLYGTGEDVIDKRTGRPTGYKEEGMVGALKGMNKLIERGKTPISFKGTLEEYIVKRDKFEQVIEKLKSLPSEEHAIPVLKLVQDRFTEAADLAKKAGVLDGTLENYVTHVLDFSKTKMTVKEQQAFTEKIFGKVKESKLNRDFTITRQYQFLRDLEKAVEGTGVVVHTDIAKIVPIYEKSIYAAIAHKEMVDTLSKGLAPDGKKWLAPITADVLKEKYVVFHGKGKSALEGLAVHPDLVDTMTHIMNIKDPELMLRAMGSISHLVKTLNTVASLFHAKSLIEAGGLASPGLMLKEIFTAGAGMRAARNALINGGEGITKKIAGKDYNMEKLIDGFIKNGLVIAMEDIKRTIVADIGQASDRLLSRFAPKDKNIRAIQHLTEPFDKHVLQKLNAFTWDYMHAGQKLNVAIHKFTQIKTRNPEIPDEQIMKEVSLFVNKTFGGLDWLAEAMTIENKFLRGFATKAAGIHGREWAQILFFAPDWTVSTLRAVTNALPKELSKPQNWKLREGVKGIYNPITSSDLSRRYVINTAIAWFTIINGINMATSGHPIWENKDPTRIEMPDGTSVQAAKHSMEAAHWAMDPTKTFGNKLGFIPKAVYVEISGHAYPSIDAPKIKPLYKGYGGMELAKAKAIAATALPFQLNAAIQAPEGKGLERGVMSTLGVPKYGMNKEERAKLIREGRKDAVKARGVGL